MLHNRFHLRLFFYVLLTFSFTGSGTISTSAHTTGLSEKHLRPSSSKKQSKRKPEIKSTKKSVKKPRKGYCKAVPAVNKLMPPLKNATLKSEVTLLPLINKAKSQLGKQVVSCISNSRGYTKKQVRLALADFKTGEIDIVSGWMRPEDIILHDRSVKFEVEWRNGFNSMINIIEPPNKAVIGLLYPLNSNTRKLLKKRSIVYTPYSHALLQQELIDAGKQHLIESIAHARSELSHVKSKVPPVHSLAQSPFFSVIDYVNIIIAEHMDPYQFNAIISDSRNLTASQQSDLRRLAERILVIIGSNGNDAYSFTGSHAGARGLTQFTSKGMKIVWENYPDAGISQDFYEATSNHTSSIKAQICLLDRYLGDLATAYPKLLGSGYEVYAAAAAYNGGPERVISGLNRFGVRWLNPRIRLAYLSQQKQLGRKHRLEYKWLKENRPHETFIYLNKLCVLKQCPLT